MKVETIVPENLTSPLATIEAEGLKITFDEFVEKVQEDERAEWVDGDIVIMPAVTTRHFKVNEFLIRLFYAYLDVVPVGEIFYADILMRTGRGKSARLPDIMFIRNERLTTVKSSFVEEPADLVVEMVSADSRIRDRRDKYKEYELGGVSEYWIIDPRTETAEFYQLGDGKYSAVPTDGGGFYHVAQLPGLRVKVDWLWMDPLPRVQSIAAEAGIPAP